MRLLHPRTTAFLAYFAGAYPTRTALMVSLLVLSGLLEGVSVITLVPLLESASQGSSGAPPSGVERAVTGLLAVVGIEPTLMAYVGLIVLGITMKSIVLWMAMRQVGFTMARVTLDLRLELVRALLRARWSYFGTHPLGNFANGIGREAVRSASAYREGCTVLGGLVQVLTYLVISALISWQVTVVALLTGGLLLVGLRYYVAMGRSAGEDAMLLTRSLVSRLVDALQGIKPMKAMAREDLFWPLLEGEAEALNRADRRSVTATESIRLFQEPAVALALGLSLVLLLTVTNASFASVVALAFVFYRMMASVNTLQMQYQNMVNGESMFWSLRNQIDDAKSAEEKHSGTREPGNLEESIELRGVSYAYGDLQVLRDLSIHIPANQLTAIIGQSGSGKTTILDLITGLHRPAKGEVYLDGVPLAEIDLRLWRQEIGYVPQEVFLFHDTVRRNVTLGDDTISDERVVQALKDAGAWDFIDRDPRGLDAMISPQGSGLSGGQRQRLAIARALVKNPTLIVLDEATTGLDSETEAAVLETLQALRKRVTVLAISHQPALRDAADVVLELQNGQLQAADQTPAAVLPLQPRISAKR